MYVSYVMPKIPFIGYKMATRREPRECSLQASFNTGLSKRNAANYLTIIQSAITRPDMANNWREPEFQQWFQRTQTQTKEEQIWFSQVDAMVRSKHWWGGGLI